MADQNQNSQNQIPGQLRTLKTDLEMIKSNPQDRLQQAGNFVQARPEPVNSSTNNIQPNGTPSPAPTVSALSVDSDVNPNVTKKDIPEVPATPKAQPNHSWSNMDIGNNKVNNSEFKPTPQAPVENKSGFSVLDDSIDLPLDNSINIQPNNTPSPTPTVSALSIDSDVNPKVTKKDIPEVPATPKAQPNYSWSNMSTSNNKVNNSEFKPTPQVPVENKSGFSVLDDSMDLPLDKSINSNNANPTTEFQPSNPIGNQSATVLPPTTESNNQANTFDINSLNLQDDAPAPKPKKSSKGLFSALIVIILVGLIGGGLYFYFNMSSNTTDIVDNTDTNTDNNIDDTTDDESEEPSPEFSSLLTQDSAVNISFVDSEPIRRTIATVLTDKSDTLIQLNLTKDNTSVNLIDTADALGITIPSVGTIRDYKFYAYNQQGVYKLVAVLGLEEGQDSKIFVDNWSSSIPRDLAGFSINLPSRIVNTPEIKKSIITNNSGKIFENYYYNYTSPADSVDVSSYENYILIASSQDSMQYILDQIR